MKQVKPLDNSAEEQAPSTEANFGDILSQFEQEQHQADVKPGETVEGTVISVNADNVVVDIGRKTEGIIPVAAAADILPLDPGTKITVNVVGRDEEGYYKLSTIRVERPKDWSALQSAFDEKR